MELRLSSFIGVYRGSLIISLQPFTRKWGRHVDGRSSRMCESGEGGPTVSVSLLPKLADVMLMIDSLLPRHRLAVRLGL